MNPAMAKRSHSGNPYCGDEFSCWMHGGKIILCIVDGLGHGEDAEKAAKAAVRYVGNHLSESLDKIFTGCDYAIRRTRGVAMGIAVVDEKRATLTFGGIGNTVAKIFGGETKILTCDAGIVGGGFKTFMPQPVHISPGELLVMHTDGITDQLDISGYSATLQKDLSKLAAAVIDDWGRENDDSAVLIYRYGGLQC